MNKAMLVYERAAEHLAAQAIEEDAIGMELPVEVVAVPDSNACLIFEFKNEVAPAVQDLNVVAFERWIRKGDDIIVTISVGRKDIRHPNIRIWNKDGNECGVYATQIISDHQPNLLGPALRESNALGCVLKIKIAAVREYPGPGGDRIKACASVCQIDNLIDIRINRRRINLSVHATHTRC